jgi:hypothetical protein
MVILMVADYFKKERGSKLYAHDWSRVLNITMGNDLVRPSGTYREDLLRAVRLIGLRYRKIHKKGEDGDREALKKAIHDNHPVVVECKIPDDDKPAKHYAVLAKMEDETLFFADPFPHADTRRGNLRRVRWDDFKRKRWSDGLTVWGRDRWGIEVYPSSRSNR